MQSHKPKNNEQDIKPHPEREKVREIIIRREEKRSLSL
jgi:hypothetical protein